MDSVVVDTSALSGVSIMQGREVFKGTWDSESKRLSAKARSASPRFDADARSANLEGYVARDAAGRLHVDGISLEGAHQRLEPGTRVRVRARFSGGGMRWQARAIRSLREGPMIRGLNRNLRAPVSPEAALLPKVAPPHQRPTEKPPSRGPQSGPEPPRHHVPRPGSDVRPPHPNQPSPRDVIGPRGGGIRPGGGLRPPHMPPPPPMM